VNAGTIELWPAGDVTTDVERFEAASASAVSTGDIDLFRAAVDLYTGDLLPDDRDEPWSEDRRRTLREAYVRALRGARLWNRLLEVDATDEEAHRELIRGYLEAGKRQAAIRQFERLREVLREELGVGPDPLSVALY